MKGQQPTGRTDVSPSPSSTARRMADVLRDADIDAYTSGRVQDREIEITIRLAEAERLIDVIRKGCSR